MGRRAHHQLPLLIVVHNNRSYGRDERHQRVVAEARSRSLENLPVGIHIDHPPIDFARLAESMGVVGFGPVEKPEALLETLREAKKYRSDRASRRAGRRYLQEIIYRARTRSLFL